MQKILIINTGGTFNKRYNPLEGELEVPRDAKAVLQILQYTQNLQYDLVNIIHKDSLEMNLADREQMAATIFNSKCAKILIIHGTDTMDITAQYLAQNMSEKSIVLCGAMMPLSIDVLEATTNFALSLGFLLAPYQEGVFIGMHGMIEPWDRVFKNREIGVFCKK